MCVLLYCRVSHTPATTRSKLSTAHVHIFLNTQYILIIVHVYVNEKKQSSEFSIQ